MEKKKISVFIILCLMSLKGITQEDAIERTGMFRGQANLAGSYIMPFKQFGTFITGDFNYYLNPQVSITGEGWYMLPVTEKQLFTAHHNLLGGITWHLSKNTRWDPYLAFTPGISFTAQRDTTEGNNRITPVALSPALTLAVGCNYYAGSIFHFFVKIRYLYTNLIAQELPSSTLHEIRITAGLGFNFRKKKIKSQD
ncbi:MAG: hypothetical protein N2167_11050 [Flavobacteriales bacterium]|nr:hypothetical protein [Flavobacteriales bacterium]